MPSQPAEAPSRPAPEAPARPAPEAPSRPAPEAPATAAPMPTAWRELYLRERPLVLPRPHGDLGRRLAASDDLKALLDSPPTLSSRATRDLDGRRDRIVVVVARDASGAPVPGVLARLLENGTGLRDHTRTDARGVALLVEPSGHAAHHGAAAPPMPPLTVEVLLKGRDPIRRPVAIPAGKQHQVMEIVIDPPLETAIPVVMTDGAPAGRATVQRLVEALELRDNPLDRLPSDFSTDLCLDLKNILGPTEDPIFGIVEGAGDFRKRRIPLVKRMTIPRVGAPQPGGRPPRRYLVRVRQEWTFLGYTLGELVEVDALDPGAILDETTRTVDRAVTTATRAVEDLVSRATESAFSSLHQAATIDNLLTISNSVRTHAAAGGFGLALGPLVIGGAGGTAGVSTRTAVRNRTDASLDVNSSLHVAKSVVNSAARSFQSARRELQTAVTSVVKQVSPLLSRVTNLLRWTLYENYMVCTHVEDVVEVVDVPIADLGPRTSNLFTDEQIVDLRRIFSPALLEPRLRPHFDTLAAAVNARRGGDLPIVAAHVTVEYSTGPGGSTLTARIGADETTFHLRPGSHRATQTIRLASPVDDSALTAMDLDLALGPSATIFGAIVVPNAAQVSRVEIAYQTASGFVRRQSIPLGDALRVTQDQRTAATTATLSVPPPAVFTQHDPLVVHVNANRSYYFGLLCQAALYEPSLRDDLPHFGAFDGDHELWRLPIVGFEGNRALVVKDADPALPEVQDLLRDPGAATLVQLAAPGAYAEALQGLLKLAVDAEKVHPALIPAPAPVMPPLAIVDATGRPIPVLGAGEGAGGVVGGAAGAGSAGGAGTGGVVPPVPTP